MADFKESTAFAIRKGQLWISAINVPNSTAYQERWRGRSVMVFAGADRLELSIEEARSLRDWITSVLPDSAHGSES